MLRQGSLAFQLSRNWLDLQGQQGPYDIQASPTQKIKRQDEYTDIEAEHLGQKGRGWRPSSASHWHLLGFCFLIFNTNALDQDLPRP